MSRENTHHITMLLVTESSPDILHDKFRQCLAVGSCLVMQNITISSSRLHHLFNTLAPGCRKGAIRIVQGDLLICSASATVITEGGK